MELNKFLAMRDKWVKEGFSKKQIKVLAKGAQQGLDISLLENKDIKADFMEMYLDLMRVYHIDIEMYVRGYFHKQGKSVTLTKYLILAMDRQIELDEIDFSTEETAIDSIRELMNNQQFYREAIAKGVDKNILDIMEKIGFRTSVKSFLVRQYLIEQDISYFLTPEFKDFTFAQIKYLWSCYTTGIDIKPIMNPDLSVEEMNAKILSVPESKKFVSDISENLFARQGKTK